ncbi:MAG TPA: hypothetical protein VM694_20180, partial [Polyangium sp.]|nr:hypothetical protein [Polyangium sp.]
MIVRSRRPCAHSRPSRRWRRCLWSPGSSRRRDPEPAKVAAVPNPNYITPEGARRLSEELGRLRSVDRPRIVQEVADAAAQGDRSENAEYIYGKR